MGQYAQLLGPQATFHKASYEGRHQELLRRYAFKVSSFKNTSLKNVLNAQLEEC
jgi:hypothetical protein